MSKRQTVNPDQASEANACECAEQDITALL
jgi:hypothetical protein